MFHFVRPRYKNDIKLKDCYKSYLQKSYLFTFCCVATGIHWFDQRKAVEIALATVKLWQESNHSSVDGVIFCLYENADYKTHKDLMSTIYFPVSKIHLTNNYMKKRLIVYLI